MKNEFIIGEIYKTNLCVLIFDMIKHIRDGGNKKSRIYCNDVFVSALLTQISWSNHLAIMSKAKR